MRLIDYIMIPFKNIMRQKLRSSLTIVAIVIGSLAVISVLSLVFGAENAFRKQMESVGQFTVVQVSPDQQNMDNGGPFGGQEVTDEKDKKKLDNSMMDKLRKVPHVIGASAGVNVWSIQSISTKGGDGKKFRAELVANELGVASQKKILAGRDFTSDDERGKIIIGAHLIGSLGFKSPQDAIGKTLILTTQKGYQGEGAEIPLPTFDGNGPDKNRDNKDEGKVTEIEAEIIGVTTPPAVGSNGGTFVTMGWARKLMSWSHWEEDKEKRRQFEEQHRQQFGGPDKKQQFGGPDMRGVDPKQFMVLKSDSEIDMKGYQFASVKVDEAQNAKAVAERIKKMGLGAITADDMLKIFTNIAKIIGALLAALGAISLGVAAIGIINTMAMAMLERTREIGIMRACGARRKTVRRLFTAEAAALGFCGGAVGIILGLGLSKLANYFINNFLTSQSVSAVDVISLPLWLVLATISLTTFLGLISGIYPAHRAARVNPVEALRYE